MKPIFVSIVLGLMTAATAMGAEGESERFAPIFEGGGIEVYLKIDFDEGDNPFTAQGKAAKWILEDDPMNLPLEAENLIQRYILAYLYYELSANGTRPWNYCNPPAQGEADKCLYNKTMATSRWLSGASECDWSGVSCGESVVIGLEISESC